MNATCARRAIAPIKSTAFCTDTSDQQVKAEPLRIELLRETKGYHCMLTSYFILKVHACLLCVVFRTSHEIYLETIMLKTCFSVKGASLSYRVISDFAITVFVVTIGKIIVD